MERRQTRLLSVAGAIVAVALGFAAGAAATDNPPVGEMSRMHDETPGIGMHGHDAHGAGDQDHAVMDEMHAEMSARLAPADAAIHHRMHAACSGSDEGTK